MKNDATSDMIKIYHLFDQCSSDINDDTLLDQIYEIAEKYKDIKCNEVNISEV